MDDALRTVKNYSRLSAAKLSPPFPHLIDHAAFIDTLMISVWGRRRLRPLRPVRAFDSYPIGGPRRPFARCLPGVCDFTGNPVLFNYGRNPRLGRAPDLSLYARSESAPLTRNEIETVLGCLVRKGFRARISRLEFTFDLSGTVSELFRRGLFTSAHRVQEIEDARGRLTLYIGSPHSPWQIRAYQKMREVSRFEFVFRLPFLRPQGIDTPHDVLSLKNLDIGRLVWFRELREARLQHALRRFGESWQKHLLLDIAGDIPLSMLANVLRSQWGVKPDRMFRRSPVEERLRRMRENLVW